MMVLKLGNHLVCQKDNQTEEEKGKTKNNKICKILRRHTQRCRKTKEIERV